MLPKHRQVRAGALMAAATCLVTTAAVFGGGTPTSQPHTPQGAQAGTANGDYFSSPGPGGTDDPYRYWVEKTGTGRLDIDLWDADIGAGPTNEDDLNRDRNRGSYQSTVDYDIFAPNGSAVSQQFYSGSNSTPTGADNTWLNVFSSEMTFADDFSGDEFFENDGTNNFTGSWVEIGDGSDGPDNGDVQIVSDGGNQRLRIDNASNGLSREANLNGVTSATLTFCRRRSGLDNSSDYVAVEARSGGGTWTELGRFAGPTNDASCQAEAFSLTPFIALDTEIRFISPSTLGNNDFVFFDDVVITTTGAVAGHWEIRVDMRDDAGNTVADDNDINALGIRAHDGTSGSGGTEHNLYVDTHAQYGTNQSGTAVPGDFTSRTYDLYPWITSGCSWRSNEFDYDAADGSNTSQIANTSPLGTFTQTLATSDLSANNVWEQNELISFSTDSDRDGYGLWHSELTITTYVRSGALNSNYTNFYASNFQAANPETTPPTDNPSPDTFRVYMPTDAGAAPVKPYIHQFVRYTCGDGGPAGPNPPQVGQTTCFTVTVRVTNPTASSITFSTPSNIVTSNVPGSGVVYGGGAQVGQGSIVSQPAVGGTGNVTWNPGTLTAGSTAILAYRVNVTPTSNGQRLPVTATPASGNGTRAQWLDETASSQPRATYLFGPLCELAVTENLLTYATVDALRARVTRDGRTLIEWDTHSEAGTLGFVLERQQGRRWVAVGDLIASLPESHQGAHYAVVDREARRAGNRYRVRELTRDGSVVRGEVTSAFDQSAVVETPASATSRTPHATDRRPRAANTRHPAPTANGTTTPAEAMAIVVGDSGLVGVETPTIASYLGLTVDQVETAILSGDLRLTRGGIEVAWTDWPGTNPASPRGILFVGTAPDSLYRREEVYRLTNERGERMGQRGVGGGPSKEPSASVHRQRFEQDVFAATVIEPDPTSDYWFWSYLEGDGGANGTRSVAFDLPGFVDGGAELEIGMQGATGTGVFEEHQIDVVVNGAQVGTLAWTGIEPVVATFPVPSKVLAASGNLFELHARRGNGAPYSFTYLDHFDVNYERQHDATGDRLDFASDQLNGVTVAAFAAPPTFLLEIDDPDAPEVLMGFGVGGGPGGSHRLGFVPRRQTRYLAASESGVAAPLAVRAWSGLDLDAVANANYLVITTPELLPGLRPLTTLRRARGHAVHVVTVDEVMDQFNDGRFDPNAFATLVAWWLEQPALRPRYLLLAGAGTLDYRDLLGYDDSRVPPLMVQSEGGLFASDVALVDPDGDGVPNVAVGRIPALTADDLALYAAKAVAFENAIADDLPWTREALALAGEPDGDADFGGASSRLAGTLPSNFEITDIDLSGLDIGTARGLLFAALTDGASLMSYVGHGGLDRLASAGLLTSDDVPSLTSGRPPILTALTCTANRFAVPGIDPLGSRLVRQPDGGAIAVYAASGLSDHGIASSLGTKVFQELAKVDQRTLGQRIQDALAAFAAGGGDTSKLVTYVLLGDPALRIPAPQPVTGGSPGPGGE